MDVSLYSEDKIEIDIDSPFFEDFNFTFQITAVSRDSIVLQLEIDKPFLITNLYYIQITLSVIEFFNINGAPKGLIRYEYMLETMMTP